MFIGTTGRRRDGINLINEYLEGNSNRMFVQNRSQLMEIDGQNFDGQLLGLFHGSHMPYNLDTIRLNRQHLDPTLSEMTSKAIEILQREENGFFLLVEGMH